MNEVLKKYEKIDLSGRNARLFKEWKELDELCDKRQEISYIIRKRNVIGLPTEYEIWYRVRSVIGVSDSPPPREPIYGDLHKMSISLPNNYPSADGNPVFTFITDIWHPNIRHSGSFKGHVCLTIKEMGVMASLKELVLRVERYLKYQLYHAENTYPYPEDQEVAEWVREEGVPGGWIKSLRGDGGLPDSDTSLSLLVTPAPDSEPNDDSFIIPSLPKRKKDSKWVPAVIISFGIIAGIVIGFFIL